MWRSCRLGVMKTTKFIEENFLWLVLIISAIALFYPPLFIFWKPYFPYLLGIIMFGIGLTLKPDDFKALLNLKGTIIGIVILKYIIVSITAYSISIIFHLPVIYTIGFIILGCCPGGTASNVMSHLSKTNVALTVFLTFITTILSPLLMPLLIYLFLHKSVSIPFVQIMQVISTIVLIPVVLGLVLRPFFLKRRSTQKLIVFFPTLSIITIIIVIAAIIGLTHNILLSFPYKVIIGVVIMNVTGYLTGYLTSKLFRCKFNESLPVAFEFGILDSGLGTVIATGFFGPVAALPAAIYSLIQNITGAIIVKLSHYVRLPRE